MKVHLNARDVYNAIYVYMALKGYKLDSKCTFQLELGEFKGAKFEIKQCKFDTQSVIDWVKEH